MDSRTLRAPTPPPLVRPVRIDSSGRTGPTKSAAAGPSWRRTSKGLYVPRGADPSVVEQRILEESCRLPTPGAVTGWAAMRVHGVAYCDGIGADGVRTLPVPLVVPPGVSLTSAPGSIVHRERLDASDRGHVGGIPVTDPRRAVFDAARRAADLRAAVGVIDLALAARIITSSDLAGYLATRSGWPGLRQVGAALALADRRSMSPRETELRLVWTLDAGLPQPRSNWPVADADGRTIGRPDLLCEELAVIGEFDGSAHRTRSQHREDLRRDDRFRAVGLEPFRVVGADLKDRRLVLDRIAAAIDRAQHAAVPRSWQLQANPRPVR